MTNRGKHVSPSEVRFICEVELETYGDNDTDKCDYACVLLGLLGRPCTRAALAITTLAEIKHIYQKVLPRELKLWGDVEGTRMCGNCGIFEETPKSFSRCGKCLHEFYCSKNCQMKAWKEHKLLCSGGPAPAAATAADSSSSSSSA